MGKPLKDILEEFGSNLINNPETLIDDSKVYMMFDISTTIKNLLDSGELKQKCY